RPCRPCASPASAPPITYSPLRSRGGTSNFPVAPMLAVFFIALPRLLRERFTILLAGVVLAASAAADMRAQETANGTTAAETLPAPAPTRGDLSPETVQTLAEAAQEDASLDEAARTALSA